MIFDTICDKMASNPGFLWRDHRNVRRMRLATNAQEQVTRLQINLNTILCHFFHQSKFNVFVLSYCNNGLGLSIGKIHQRWWKRRPRDCSHSGIYVYSTHIDIWFKHYYNIAVRVSEQKRQSLVDVQPSRLHALTTKAPAVLICNFAVVSAWPKIL